LVQWIFRQRQNVRADEQALKERAEVETMLEMQVQTGEGINVTEGVVGIEKGDDSFYEDAEMEEMDLTDYESSDKGEITVQAIMGEPMDETKITKPLKQKTTTTAKTTSTKAKTTKPKTTTTKTKKTSNGETSTSTSR
jgi:hypothetical protein